MEREDRRLDRERGDEAEEDPVAAALTDLDEVEGILRQSVDTTAASISSDPAIV